MRSSPYEKRCKALTRKGAAAVELALVLPILLLVLFAGVDFARAYYYTQLVTEAAQKGADFASNWDLADQLPYSSLNEAALADMTNVRPAATVDVSTDWAPPTPNVTVTVTYEFQPVCSKFGLGDSFTIRRSACHRMHPSMDLPVGGEP